MNINFGARMLLNVPTETLQKIDPTKQNTFVSSSQGYSSAYVDVEQGNIIVATSGEDSEDRRNFNYLEKVIDTLAGDDHELGRELKKALGKSLASRDLYIPSKPAEPLYDLTQ